MRTEVREMRVRGRTGRQQVAAGPVRWFLLTALTLSLLAACTSATAGHGNSAADSGPAATASSSSSPSSPRSSASAGGGGRGSAGWVTATQFATLPHPDMDCAAAGQGGKINVVRLASTDIDGDGIPEAVVTLECAHSASEWPDTVEVYSDRTGTPEVIDTLLSPKDEALSPSTRIAGSSVTIGILTGSTYAAGCCPDLHYTQTFTWTGSNFAAGPRQPVITACGDTAFAVTAAAPEGAAGHGSVVLLFRNRLPIACTVLGYPGLDAVSATGAVLAHATRTPSGYAGGAAGVQQLTVAPGATVSATAEWLNAASGGGSCATSARIEVTPAGTRSTTELAVSATACGLQIHPTVAGASGQAR